MLRREKSAASQGHQGGAVGARVNRCTPGAADVMLRNTSANSNDVLASCVQKIVDNVATMPCAITESASIMKNSLENYACDEVKHDTERTNKMIKAIVERLPPN